MCVSPETLLFLVWIAQSGEVLADKFSLVTKRDCHSSNDTYMCDRDPNITSYDKRGAEDICSDFVTISNPCELFFPQDYKHLQRPWVDNPTATAATSDAVSQAIDSLLYLEVEGLDGETVENVIQEFQDNGCLSFLIGDSVRDQFLGEITTDIIDLESNCDCEKLYDTCSSKWGFFKCAQIGQCNIVYIGNVDEMHGDAFLIDSANWNKTFFGNGTSLQYTTNSIAYFADKLNVVIDITGHGVSDTCNKLIRIPATADNWDQWVTAEKLFHFWKLCVMGYRAADADTMSYVITKTMILVTEMPEHFQNLYCTGVLSGQIKNSTCSIPQDLCSEVMRKKKDFNAFFETDLDEFWSETVKPLVAGLECSSCSSFTRGDVCSAVVENGANYLLFLFFATVEIMFL